MAWTGGSGVVFVHPRLTNRGRACISRILRTAGWKEEQFWVCQPEDVPQGARAIVAMGDLAQFELTGWQGGKRATKYTRGYELPSWTGRPVVPTFDPEQVVQGQWKLLSLMMHDIGVAMGAAMGRGGVVHDPKGMVDYKEGVGALRELVVAAKAEPSALIAFDLETRGSEEEDEDETIEFSRDDNEDEEESAVANDAAGSSVGGFESGGGFKRSALDTSRAAITTVQFSLAPGTGVSAEWSPAVRELSCELMRLGNQVAGHNSWLFDRPILLNHDVPVPILTDDTMWMWHHMQPDLPAHLQGVASIVRFPFPWKHMAGSDLGFYGCLTRDSLIPLWEGGAKKISQIVAKQERVAIKGMDVDGRIIPVNVVGWRRVSVPGQRWLKIRTEATDQALYLTPDHNVWSNNQWIPAGDLKVGDVICIDKPGSVDLIHGALLGDGSLDVRGRLKITHSINQAEWLDAKRLALNGPLYEGGKGGYPQVGTEVWISQSIWRKKFYPEGKKVFVPPSYKALAIWYADDGCLANPSPTYFGNPRVYCFYENVEEALNWFKQQFGPEVSLYRDARSPHGGAIAMNGAAKFKFWEAIAPYLHPSMEYKLPKAYRGKYDGWMEEPIAQTSVVSAISEYEGRPSARYCITVDHPTHRFFAMGGLVQNCADVDAVQWIMRGLPRDMKRLGLWDCYLRYVRAFRPILEDMEKRGIPVSREKLAELREWLKVEIGKMDERLQVAVPRDIKARKYWKTWPKDCRPVVEEFKAHAGASIAGQLVMEGKKVTKKATEVKVRLGDLPPEFWKDNISALGYEWDGDKLYKLESFNPRSPLQILSYMRHQDYPIPKRFKDGKDSTADKELERLEVKTGDEVIKLTRGIRAYSKMGNAYAGKVGKDGQIEGGWYPGPDGRLRATFTFGPATGQLAARNPNVLTTPKRRPELARKFRECIVAPPGHKIIEIDMRAFHARTTGLAAESADYMRLADMDIHSFLAGHLVHYPGIETCLGMSDEDLRQYLAGIKKQYKAVRDFKAKPTILGVGFKMGHRRLYFENRDSMTDEREAKLLLDTLKGLFPQVFAWQDAICEEADRKHYLINAWGAIRWFWDVFKWQRVNGDWHRSSSRDAEKVVAYLPSSNAHYMLRDKLLQMEEQGWLERYGLINVIHDAVLFVCPDALVEECIHNVKQCLEAPVPELAHPTLCPDGFTCGAEASVGADWATMEDCK